MKNIKLKVVLKSYKVLKFLFFFPFNFCLKTWNGLGWLIWSLKKGKLPFYVKWERKLEYKKYKKLILVSTWKKDWNQCFLILLPFFVMLKVLQKGVVERLQFKRRVLLLFKKQKKKMIEQNLMFQKKFPWRGWHGFFFIVFQRVEGKRKDFLGKVKEVEKRCLVWLDGYLTSLHPIAVLILYPRIYPVVEKKLGKLVNWIEKKSLEVPKRLNFSWIVEKEWMFRMKQIEKCSGRLRKVIEEIKELKKDRGNLFFWWKESLKSWEELKKKYMFRLQYEEKTYEFYKEKKLLVVFSERKEEDKERWSKKLSERWEGTFLSDFLGKIWLDLSMNWFVWLEKMEKEEFVRKVFPSFFCIFLFSCFLVVLGWLDFLWMAWFWLIRFFLTYLSYICTYWYRFIWYSCTKKGRKEIDEILKRRKK